jgi:transcriptional regulator with XRE-family HTH domain
MHWIKSGIDMPTFGTELKKCRGRLRLTLPEMAAKLNVSTTTIINYETGERMPDVDFLIDLAETSEMGFIYWLGLRVAASQSSGAAAAKILLDTIMSTQNSSASSAERAFISLPLYDVKDVVNAAASNSSGRVSDEIPQFSTAWIRRELNAAPADLFQILVDDESMDPSLRPGDTILLDRRATKPDREGIYILQMNGLPLVKRLQLLPGGIVKVVSDNPAYETFTIPLSDFNGRDITILGRIVWVVWAGRRI